MAAVQAIIGFLTMILGRQYYAMYIGAITFMLSRMLIPRFFPNQSMSSILVISIVAGILSGGLTFMLKRWLAVIASFLIGGSLVFGLGDILGLDPAFQTWTAYLIAGVISAVLCLLVFDFAITLLSALYGAALILESVHLPGFSMLIWLVLLGSFGIVVQWVLLQYGHPEPD